MHKSKERWAIDWIKPFYWFDAKFEREYLQYLYIQNLENSDNSKEKTVIYVPTERGIPIPITESQRLKQN